MPDLETPRHWTCRHCQRNLLRGDDHDCDKVGTQRTFRVLQRADGEHWKVVRPAIVAMGPLDAIRRAKLEDAEDVHAFCPSDLRHGRPLGQLRDATRVRTLTTSEVTMAFKLKKGALHRQLGIPQGKPIPTATLQHLTNSQNPTTRKRAQFALNARHFRHHLGRRRAS